VDKLASNPALLLGFTDRLMRNRNTCPLFDSDRFARHIEAVYTTMWETWLRAKEPECFSVEAIGVNECGAAGHM
jgi:protein O-GlcNAc transferase